MSKRPKSKNKFQSSGKSNKSKHFQNSGKQTRQNRSRRDHKNHPQGIITITRKGFAFVSLEEGQENIPEADIFIPPQFVGNALTGDLVKVRIKDLYNPKGPSGEVVEVVQRKRTTFVGQVVDAHPRKSRIKIKPISNSFSRTLAAKRTLEVNVKDWVEFSIERTESDYGFDVELIRQIPTRNNISGILDSLTEEYELPAPYSEEEEEMARNLPLQNIERRDLTNLTTMTIDPIDAKDYDDALSIVHEDEKNITIGIHIADVAAYLPPGSYFDKKASDRCFTNYLPGRMIPMLPRTLLKERCSLNADEVKPAHSIFVTLSKNSGEVKNYERFHSFVKVSKRLHYDEVQQYLNSQGLSFHKKKASMFEYESGLTYTETFESTWQSWAPNVRKSIDQLFNVYKTVRSRRKALEHYIDVMPKEIRILCGGHPPEIKGIRHEKSDEAHEIVEEFMLMANTLVAEEMFHGHLPSIYRTHPAPNTEALVNFSRWLHETLQVKTGSLATRKNINKLLHTFDPKDPYFDVIMISFVKAMERANYDSTCQPHYGLGKEKYLHFTSPIRRYTDLFVHQQLWAADTGDYKIKEADHANAAANKCTKTEQRYDEAYWAANDRLKLHFIAEKVATGEEVKLEAVIMNFARTEISIFLPEIGTFGSIPLSSLGDFYQLSDDNCELYGKKENSPVYKKGQILYVHVEHVNTLYNELTFTPVI